MITMRTGREREGTTAKNIEHYTKHVPSDAFLWTAVVAILGSLALISMGKREQSLFIGQWAPTLLILGMYNKIVKLLGHEG